MYPPPFELIRIDPFKMRRVYNFHIVVVFYLLRNNKYKETPLTDNLFRAICENSDSFCETTNHKLDTNFVFVKQQQNINQIKNKKNEKT